MDSGGSPRPTIAVKAYSAVLESHWNLRQKISKETELGAKNKPATYIKEMFAGFVVC